MNTLRTKVKSQTSRDERDIRDTLCGVMSPEVADAFIAHRKAKRARLTPHAARLIAKKLAGNPNANAIVETSIANGWTGVFPENPATAPPKAPKQPDIAAIMAKL